MVSYSIADYAVEAEPIVYALINFGLKHRMKIKKK